MFYYIKGKVALVSESYVVIDAGGIGYKITTSGQSISACSGTGTEAVFYTHLHVREDAVELFGFCTEEELSAFELLITVSGVGPKAAISLLSVMTAPNLALAVVTNDVKAITKAQGIGPKMAQRIILELKDKIKNEQLPSDSIVAETTENYADNEAIDALVVLGYSVQEAQSALSKAGAINLPAEEAIKKALKYLIR